VVAGGPDVEGVVEDPPLVLHLPKLADGWRSTVQIVASPLCKLLHLPRRVEPAYLVPCLGGSIMGRSPGRPGCWGCQAVDDTRFNLLIACPRRALTVP
jgi:hypothetical protein